MFNEEEIKVWEEEVDSKRFDSWKTEKKYVDPRKKAYKEYRNRRRGYRYHYKESYSETIIQKRKFRQKMTRSCHQEDAVSVIAKDYHTYGWMTW